MDYKNIIKSRKLRLKLLRLLSFVPDKLMLKVQYRMKTGHKLDLNNPKRFTEKLQWYKLNYKNPLMIQCVDKYDVREYVESKGLSDILIPCYGVFNSPNEIDWNALPNQFVMKDTLAGGGTSVLIVKDKSKEDIEELKRQATEWVSIDAHKKSAGREWPYYSGKKHRIIIESLLPSNPDEGGLIDYKFFCFNGEPSIVYVVSDRRVGKKAFLGVFSSQYEKLNVLRCDEDPPKRDVPKPKAYEKMLDVCRKLSKPFPEVRVDLYYVEGKIYIGEMTFYDGSGYMKFEPDSFDMELGNLFIIPEL